MDQKLKSSPPREKMTFTDYLRVYTRPLIDPIVTFMARYRFSPDALTVIGTLSHILFAWLIATDQMRWAAVAMFFLAPLDALDGALARKLGRKQSGFGAFLDSSLDRIAEIILFGGFILHYMEQGDAALLAVAYLAITGSLMVSYARARAESLGYSSKVGILSRVERYAVMMFFLVLDLPHIALIILAVFTYITVAQRMYHVWKQAYKSEE
jgi:CDP-diacylglycerol--glycerol-3-phosphate 3-phosphatidyltransferase